MPNWFILSLVAPTLWGVVNHIDKHILSRYQEGRGVGAILIFSSLSSFIILPFIVYFHFSAIFNISLNNFFVLSFIGFLGAMAFYFYLKAMDIEEASTVIPLFQLDPIFGYILGYFLLGESLNVPQIFSSLLILLGILMLSVEIDINNKFTLKKKVLSLIISASFLFAVSGVLFKKLALENGYWVSIFWQYVGLTIFGIVVLIFYKKFRQNFIAMITAPKLNVLSLNVVSELLYIVGGLANNFAILIAPVALVFVVNSYQSLFVFLSAVLLTIFFPKFISEKISKKHLFHKIISIGTILIGSYFLYSTSH
ncbi:MAG: EamA family transporter [Patescibacteria group bacterium]|jgi:drug/metabolite transporter (DMT)-like permease